VLLLLFSCGVVAIWDLAVATDTIHYLGQLPGLLFPSAQSSVDATPQAATSPQVLHYLAARSPVPVDNAPEPWDLLGRASIALIVLLIPLAIFRAWRSTQKRTPQYYTTMLLACGYYLLIPLFVLAPGGNELVGRGEVFVMVPVAILLGSFADTLTSTVVMRHRHSRRSLLSSAINRVLTMAAV
jgi:cation transport ATPase